MILYSLISALPPKKKTEENKKTERFSTDPSVFLSDYSSSKADLARISAYSLSGSPVCPATFTNEISI